MHWRAKTRTAILPGQFSDGVLQQRGKQNVGAPNLLLPEGREWSGVLLKQRVSQEEEIPMDHRGDFSHHVGDPKGSPSVCEWTRAKAVAAPPPSVPGNKKEGLSEPRKEAGEEEKGESCSHRQTLTQIHPEYLYSWHELEKELHAKNLVGTLPYSSENLSRMFSSAKTASNQQTGTQGNKATWRTSWYTHSSHHRF